MKNKRLYYLLLIASIALTSYFYMVYWSKPNSVLPEQTAESKMADELAQENEGNHVEEQPEVYLSTTEVYQGDYLAILLASLQPEDEVLAAAGWLLEASLLFPHQTGKIGLMPVSYRTAPGIYSLDVEINREGSLIAHFSQEITVLEKKFPVQHLKVSQNQQAQRDDKLWEEDRTFTERARSATSPYPIWEGEFIMPAKGKITTEYGVIRYINQVESGRHSGLDIAAPTGAPVVAANGGIVTLAQKLNVTGNTIIIHHGFNLFSSYSHLDRLLVEEGQQVAKGEKIGTVGSTGFSTGPHLHWSMLIGSVFINPWQVLEEDLLAVAQESGVRSQESE